MNDKIGFYVLGCQNRPGMPYRTVFSNIPRFIAQCLICDAFENMLRSVSLTDPLQPSQTYRYRHQSNELRSDPPGYDFPGQSKNVCRYGFDVLVRCGLRRLRPDHASLHNNIGSYSVEFGVPSFVCDFLHIFISGCS